MWLLIWLGLSGPVNMQVTFHSQADCVTWAQVLQRAGAEGDFACVEVHQ